MTALIPSVVPENGHEDVLDDRAPSADELLAAYADDPSSLAPAERAAVEARCAQDPALADELVALRAMLGELRRHDGAASGPAPALEARIKAAVVPAPRRGRWIVGGLALAAAAALAVWLQTRPDDTPAVAERRPEAAPSVPAPAVDDGAPLDEDALDDLALDELALDDDLDELALDEDAGLDHDTGLDPAALIGRAIERVPHVSDEEDVFPGLDTGWLDELSEAEVEQALRWLDQQGAG